MPHFFFRDPQARLGVYRLAVLGDYALVATLNPPIRRHTVGATHPADAVLRVSRNREHNEMYTFLVALSDSLLVNGERLIIGGRLLQDKDRIALPGGQRLCFSTEELAVVAPAPDTELVCFRCKQSIGPGSPSVKCPGCGAYHHQVEPLQCWTYSAGCAACGAPTDLSRPSFRFVPEDL